MFEYLVSEAGEWEHWSNRVPAYDYPQDSTPEYLSILVPNVDNVRMDYLMHAVMKQVGLRPLTNKQEHVINLEVFDCSVSEST